MLHSSVISVLFSLACIFESVVGLLQVAGRLESHHVLFAMTGTFGNPGPYGGFIAMTAAVSACQAWSLRGSDRWLHRALTGLGWTAAALGAMVLPASMSRGAWLALGVAGVVFGFRELGWKVLWRRYRTVGWLCSCALVLAMAGVFLLKKDSALGRLHIWQMDLAAIAARPWTGAGAGRAMGAYGEVQAAFFANPRAPWRIRVAGCPEYPFNDFLGVGMEFGLPVMAVVCLLTGWIGFRLARKKSPLLYGWLVLCIFALSSYPMALWPFRVAAVLMAVGAVGIAFAGVIVAGACWLAPVQLKEQRAVDRYDHIRSLPTEGMEEAVAADYAGLYCDLHDNYRYLYDYGYALFRCGRYADAIPVLERGAGRSSDPMFWVIIGRCQEGLGRYPDAIRSLEYAWRMVPGRLYPLVLLKEMHERLGDLPGAEEYKERAGNVPLNPRNRNMMELHERIGK